MEALIIIRDTFFSLAFIALVFIPMERVFPAKPGQRIFRPQLALDFCFFLGQYLFWGALVLTLLSSVGQYINGVVPEDFRQLVAQQPIWLQIMEVILLSDILIYWGHRLQHKSAFLWRFHKVHHSTQHLDWMASHREHPLDSLYTIGLINLPAFILGFPLETLAGFITFRGIWAVYIHSNVRLNLGPLKMLIGSPEIHHWHHDKDRNAGNYANLSPLMDLIFGTYKAPDHEPREFGIEEETSSNYVAQLVEPLLPKKVWSLIRKERLGRNISRENLNT